MNTQQDYNTLVEKYPLLFSHPEGSMEPFALFGFECDIGWYHIIDRACEIMYRKCRSIKLNIDYYTTHHDTSFLDELKKSLTVEEQGLPKVVQVKEKFGTLRFYIEGGTAIHSAVADMAESMSEVTCEKCGNNAITFHMGWHKTLCLKHAVERYGEEKVTKYLESHAN